MERRDLLEAMASPGFYPHGPERVDVVETHISWVFLAGPLVYKVKKPVVFPFGVRALVPHDGGWALADGPDDPGAAEYAVEMRRFDESATLAARLAAGQATGEQLRAVGRRLAEFHASAAPVAAPGGWPAHLARSLHENFETLLSFAGRVLDGRRLAAGERFISAFLVARRDELAGRAADGRVRDCHGDLRAEHLIFEEEGVEAFDCVEFSPALREIDVPAPVLRGLSRMGTCKGRVPEGGRAREGGRPARRRVLGGARAGSPREAARLARPGAPCDGRMRRGGQRQKPPGPAPCGCRVALPSELRRRAQGAARPRGRRARACLRVLAGGERAHVRRAGPARA